MLRLSRPRGRRWRFAVISLVEVLNYRCLRYVSQPVKPFQVLVGPTGSGKTTFLDVLLFLRDVVSVGLDAALAARATDPRELLFRGRTDALELAVEAVLPDSLRQSVDKPALGTVRYQASVGLDQAGQRLEFRAETLALTESRRLEPSQRTLFPEQQAPPQTLLLSTRRPDNKVLVTKVPNGKDNFYVRRGWASSFNLGPSRSALGCLPPDEGSFPIATWFRELLVSGIQSVDLDLQAIRHPCRPGLPSGFRRDGANLPWVAARLRKSDPDRHRAWIRQLRTALPDLKDVEASERPQDRARFLTFLYDGDLRVPSWLVSDGTLRLAALALLAHLEDLRGVYVIEEPEVGMHPRAVATSYESLRSIASAQLLLTSHSPLVLDSARPEELLCFAKDADGATDIVVGSEHPKLQEWKQDVNLGALPAPGVLG